MTLTYTVFDAAPGRSTRPASSSPATPRLSSSTPAFTRADGHRIVAEVLDSGKT